MFSSYAWWPHDHYHWCLLMVVLTHWGRDKMINIFQMTFSNAFSWIKVFEFWILLTKVCSFVSNRQQCNTSSDKGAEQAMSHYLNQWWPRLVMHISLGLNELTLPNPEDCYNVRNPSTTYLTLSTSFYISFVHKISFSCKIKSCLNFPRAWQWCFHSRCKISKQCDY